jgi:tRNA pseudouridine55 synthase
MNGLLVLDKSTGLSSHSAVHRVRKITGIDRAGHAGTLDPMATGVLLVLLGSAVRLSEYVVDHDKEYRALVKLGIDTDTYDATGTIVSRREVQVTEAEIRRALESFVGRLDQVPPAHSAIQVGGRRAYKLARQGVALQLEPRAVEIYSMELRSLQENELVVDVYCSKGTYIRSLAHDLGAKLGTGAHLAGLRRLASGPFTLKHSLTFDQVSAAVADGSLAARLQPMDLVLRQFDALYLSAEQSRAVRNGQFIPALPNLTTPLVRAYDERGALLAVLERVSDTQLKPKKVLNDRDTPQSF